jgi:hypothetical protein
MDISTMTGSMVLGMWGGERIYDGVGNVGRREDLRILYGRRHYLLLFHRPDLVVAAPASVLALHIALLPAVIGPRIDFQGLAHGLYRLAARDPLIDDLAQFLA